jgi:hypothetical protein
MTTRIIFALSLACLLFSVTARAQTGSTGALTGTVTDPQGASLSGVEITVTSETTGEKRSTVSRASGDYSVPQLLPGSYRVEFARTGFKTAVKPGLRVNVTETSRLEVQLEVGQVTETVNVSSGAELLQTDSPALGRVVDAQRISNMPLSTRNYTQIVGLSPGIAAAVGNATALGRGAGGESGGQFRSNGAFGADNNFLMNGVQINDLQASGSFSGGIAIPNPDTLQEFKVQTGLYDASFGRNAGANVNVVTKSGGNQFHGTAFEFFRNDKLNANDFFRNRAGQPRGVLRQNQFGGTIGGPIKKDKLLFFGSYQGTRQINGVAGNSTANILSPAFTNDRTRAALGAMFAGQRGALQGTAGPAILADGSNIAPQAIALLNLKRPDGQFVIPTPQTVNPALPFAQRGFSAFSEPGTFDEDQYMVNLDFIQTANSRISGRFFSADSDLAQPFPNSQLGVPVVPGFPYLIPNKFRNLSVAHVYTFSPTLVNQFDFGFHRTRVGNHQQELFKWSDIGSTAPPVADKFPVIGVNGSLATGGNGQTVEVNQDHYDFQDSLTYIRGRHTFRIGGGYTHSHVDLANFTFFGGVLALSWADLLLGLPAASNGSAFSNLFLSIDLPGDLDRSWIVKDGNLYIQDDFKLTSSFTLNLGLRYERLGHLADTGGRNAGFDISLATLTPPAAGSLAGFTVASNFPGTIPAGVTQLDNEFGIHGEGMNNFDPRVGFAWKLPNSFLPFSERMVLRGGYGIYHTRATGQAFLQLATARPFAALRQFQGAPNAAASLASPFQPAPTLPAFVPYLPTTSASQLLSTSFVDPDYRPPMTQQYNFNIQADLGHNLLLEAGYVGTRGKYLVFSHTLNQALLASPANPIRGATTNTLANVQLRVPIEGFVSTGLNDIDSIGISRYNSLQLSLTKRVSRGLQFLAAYTFARSYSDAATNTSAAGTGSIAGNQNDRHANYGLSDFNREHRFVLSYVYDFPSPTQFNSVVNHLLGGWSLAGGTTIQSGVPLTLTGTNGSNAFGITTDRVQLAAGCTYANLVTSGSTTSRLGGASGGSGYFNRVCVNGLTATGGAPAWPLVEAGGGTNFGNSGVGVAVGPGQNNSDIAIIKRTHLGFLGESGNIEFRTELFNAFNHPQFGNPVTNATSTSFGVISTTAVNPRIIQFGLKLNF